MTFLKNNLKLIIFLCIFGLIGGYFTTVYSIESLDAAMLSEVLAEAGSVEIVILVGTLQAVIYSVGLGLLGKILAEKIGLWRSLSFEKNAMIQTAVISLVGGVFYILFDYLVFGRFSDVIRDSYAVKPSIAYIISCITYAPVVEEVMLRLFLMSLIAFIIWKLSRKEEVSEQHLVIANIVAAVLFSLGHIPATAMLIGLTPMIVFRCFFMNGAFGLAFGYLYRKQGIQYSMLAHAGVHVISKLIWILFI